MPEMWNCCFFPWQKSTFRQLLNYHNCKQCLVYSSVQKTWIPGGNSAWASGPAVSPAELSELEKSWFGDGLLLSTGTCWVSAFHSFHLYNFIPISCLVPAVQLGKGWVQLSLWRFFCLWDTEMGGGFEKKEEQEGASPISFPLAHSQHTTGKCRHMEHVLNTKRNNQKLKPSFNWRTN